MDFTSELENVVSRNGGDEDLRQIIVGQSTFLNAIAEATKNGSPIDRVAATRKISEAIFGSQVISTDEANYTPESQMNW